MTNYELNQNDAVIIGAGRTAFSLGIPIFSNPYRKNQKLQKLWSYGHKGAKWDDDKKRGPNGRYKIYFAPIVENPDCVKCSVPVPNLICELCGDEYESTELERIK